MTSGGKPRGSANGRGPSRTDQPTPARLARQVAGELGDLLGRSPEGIVSLERTDDGWRVGVQVLEIRRIPETADVLAVYEVESDEQGNLLGYRRSHRYVRGRVEDT